MHVEAAASTSFGDTLAARFAAQAARRPDAPALVAETRTLTYRELDFASGAMARTVLAAPNADRPAAILAERGAALVIAMLACVRAGRAFVVFDLAYPRARLRELAAVSRPGLLIPAAAAVPDLGLDTPVLEPTCTSAEVSPLPPVDPAQAAYLLFTSGSTGTPKAVACSQLPLLNFIDWQARTFALDDRDRFTLLSGLSHDPVLRDVWTPLTLGASLHIPTQAALTAPGGLRDWFEQAQPTVAHMTPPLGRLLTASARKDGGLRTLRYVFWGGDVLRRDLVEALNRLAPTCESVNLYGATETPQAVAFHRTPRHGGAERAPIGAPVQGFALDILDEHGRPAAAGALGEIVVRSPFLTLGYVQDGRIPPPLPGGDVRSYATGDLGRRLADGEIAIHGRRDDQVKIRGHRVEMGEVTAAALRAPGIAQAVTLDIGEPDAARLCAFVQPQEGVTAETAAAAVRAAVAAGLPAYMAPSEVVVLAALPLLPNGKIDRRRLVAETHAAQAAASAPSGHTSAPGEGQEAELVAAWRGLFPGKAVGGGTSFAALGGDSLSYVSAYLALEGRLGRVPDGWTTLTLHDLAASAGDGRRTPFATVESAMVLRALAITGVVASHFGLLFTGGGASSALLGVSGFLFGGLQLHEAEHRRSAIPVWRLLAGLLAPLMVYELPMAAAKLLTHHPFSWANLLLYVDLLDLTGRSAASPDALGGVEFPMWYVHCVIHILMIYGALIFAFGRWTRVRRPALTAALAAVALGVSGRFLLPSLFVPGFWRGAMNPLSFFNHAPTSHLATFALAAVAGFVRGRARLWVLGATLIYALASAAPFGPLDAAAIAAVAAVLVLWPTLPLPRPLFKATYLTAGASFFIYLLHFKVWSAFQRIGLPALLAVPAALLLGIGAWSLWNAASRRLTAAAGASWRRRRRPAPAEALAAPAI